MVSFPNYVFFSFHIASDNIFNYCPSMYGMEFKFSSALVVDRVLGKRQL